MAEVKLNITGLDCLECARGLEASDVRTLLKYPEDSAGGIMTTEFAEVPSDISVQEAIEYLRHSEESQDDEMMYYVHILGEDKQLKGIVTLRDLVMADPQSSLHQWDQTEPITAEPLTPQKEVAYLIAKYDLLSIPVVHPETREMLGIVTFDDAIDIILPTAWKKRLPRLF